MLAQFSCGFSIAAVPEVKLENSVSELLSSTKNEVVDPQKFIQRSRLQRSIASENNADTSRTKTIGYLVFLLLPLLLGAWFVKKKGY